MLCIRYSKYRIYEKGNSRVVKDGGCSVISLAQCWQQFCVEVFWRCDRAVTWMWKGLQIAPKRVGRSRRPRRSSQESRSQACCLHVTTENFRRAKRRGIRQYIPSWDRWRVRGHPRQTLRQLPCYQVLKAFLIRPRPETLKYVAGPDRSARSNLPFITKLGVCTLDSFANFRCWKMNINKKV